jgi:hypothetical protein
MTGTRSENQQSTRSTTGRTVVEQYEEAGFVVTTISQRSEPTGGDKFGTANKDRQRIPQLSEENKRRILVMLGPRKTVSETLD